VSTRPAILLSVGVVALYAVVVSLHASLYGTALPVVLILSAALCGAPLVAITRPRIAIGLFCVSAFVLPLVVSPDGVWPWPWSVPALIVFVGFVAVVTSLHGWRPGLVTLLASNGGALVALLLMPSVAKANAPLADLIVTASLSVVAYFFAILGAGRLRARQELRAVRELSTQERSRRILVEERARIARELHDVVAHSMSLIQVQASTARYRVADLTDDAASEFDDIAATARVSLTEMRLLLGVLRTEDQSAELTPHQGIDDIPSLVANTRRTGVDVALELNAVPPGIPAAVQIAAFRMVQEALSNAVRHAPGSAVSATLRTVGETVHLQVHNGPADGPAPASNGSGHGLRAMRERAALLDGTLDAGPAGDGGWTVVAVLRWDREPSADGETS